jgi:hypothetical protein
MAGLKLREKLLGDLRTGFQRSVIVHLLVEAAAVDEQHGIA